MMARAATPNILAGLGQGGDDDAVRAAMGPQVHGLDLSVIRLDGGTQPRAGIDEAVVGEYAEEMARGAEFPPVDVMHDGASYWLWDGFHRVEAHRRAGHHTTPAWVRQGTRRDAVLLSVSANAKHGLRRTNADKRRSVLVLLEDQEWGEWSDREIARRCAVSHTLVANLRAELSGNGCQMETRRVQRNGTEYTMTTPQRTPAPAVASQGANYATPAELTSALREWSEAFEDAREALRGLLADVRALGSGDYKSDWGEWMDRRWYKQDLLVCLGELVDGAGSVGDRPEQSGRPAPFVPADIEEQVEAEVRTGLDGSDLVDGLDGSEQVIQAVQPPADLAVGDLQAGEVTRSMDVLTGDGRVLLRLMLGYPGKDVWVELVQHQVRWLRDELSKSLEALVEAEQQRIEAMR